VAPELQPRRAMWFMLLAIVVIGCASPTPQPDAASPDFNNCSWRDPQFGVSQCSTDDQHSGESWCTCAIAQATCTYESCENGCDCSCVTIGGSFWWSCIPDEQFSSPCPIAPPIDAGV
jgi:hypothetical protein